jgi:hypothetical protein
MLVRFDDYVFFLLHRSLLRGIALENLFGVLVPSSLLVLLLM